MFIVFIDDAEPEKINSPDSVFSPNPATPAQEHHQGG